MIDKDYLFFATRLSSEYASSLSNLASNFIKIIWGFTPELQLVAYRESSEKCWEHLQRFWQISPISDWSSYMTGTIPYCRKPVPSPKRDLTRQPDEDRAKIADYDVVDSYEKLM